MVTVENKSGTYATRMLFVAVYLFITVCGLIPCTCNAAVEGKRLPAKASAQYSAPGHSAERAVDANESTLWIANLSTHSSNNNVWFQLDLGSTRQVARLHWIAANGTPYPASAPKRYKVKVSIDGTNWKTVIDAVSDDRNEPVGDVLLNSDARYVRLETTQVNDGTGWSLGLKEIWATEGRDTAAISQLWKMQARMEDSSVRLSWRTPEIRQAGKLKIYRSTVPTDSQGSLIASLGVSSDAYTDRVPNWTPYYYWVQAVDSKGTVLGTSSKVAAFAHPAEKVSNRVETFAFWYEPYKPSDLPDSTRKYLGNASFVIGPNIRNRDDLNKLNMGLLTYLTLYQTASWTGIFSAGMDTSLIENRLAPVAFYRPTIKFEGSPPGYVPSEFCRPGHIEYNPKAIQYTTCPNSAPFREKVLGFVGQQLKDGTSGLFVDNGFEDDIAASSVCQSSAHKHYYGEDLKSADAFIGLLMEITCAVKKHNPNAIVMANAGVPKQSKYYGLKLDDVVDGRLWESYLRSSYSTPKEHIHNWPSVYKRSVELEKSWFADTPERMYVLSYPWNRDEAFFCYATAKLANLPWSANLGIKDPEHKVFGGYFGAYPELVDLRLGMPLEVSRYGGEKSGEIYVRRYENGVVVVNPSAKEREMSLPLGGGHTSYRDIYNGKEMKGNSINGLLPPESGRVYLYRSGEKKK